MKGAGLPFEQRPASIDEGMLISSLVADQVPPRDIADTLSEYKARQVSGMLGGLILGCDQVLEFNNTVITKAPDLVSARSQLLELSGKIHYLHSGAVFYEDHKPVWRVVRTAKLSMRPLSEHQIEVYLKEVGEKILSSVGCYQLESIGSQLFTRVEGDYFTILGLPLLDILGFLRTRGIGL